MKLTRSGQPLPLLPALPDFQHPRERYGLTNGFRAGDMLHLKAAVAGRPAGTVLPVLGQCLCADAQGVVYALRVYVLACPDDSVAYASRQAARFPDDYQQERWFEGVWMRFTELDLTDHADALALERTCDDAKIIRLWPNLPAEDYRQAA